MRRLISAIALLVTAGCATPTGSTDGPPLSNQTPDGQGPITITRLRAEPYSFAYNSGIADSTRLTVRTQAEWQQVWTSIWRSTSPVTPPPPMNFGREVVVVAALGQRYSGGYSIYVDSAYQRAGHVEVVIRKVSPGTGCATTAALTEPVDVAVIPVTGQPLEFRERATVHTCG
jgi:hypothetical protein